MRRGVLLGMGLSTDVLLMAVFGGDAVASKAAQISGRGRASSDARPSRQAQRGGVYLLAAVASVR
jgi:hypothetical protein